TDEQAPAVAHEDLRRGAVPAVETDEAPRQRGHDDDGEDVGTDDGDDAEGDGDGDGHERGQRINAVDEVDGIDDAHDPDHRDHGADDAKLDSVSAYRNEGEVKAETDQDYGRGGLDKELLRRVGSEKIVVNPEADDQRAAGQNGEEVGEVLGDQLRGVGVGREQHERKGEAEDDGQAAHPRRGLGVQF